MGNKKSLSIFRFSTTVIIAVIVIVVAIVLRFYRLDTIPGILNRDEAALAYNAKLILESGKDEWEVARPLQFRSFGDYKLPGYITSLVLTFSFFGQNDWSVRLPSAVAGIANVILAAILITKIVEHEHQKKSVFLQTLLLVTLTPFAIFYSRMAWEANVSLAFFLTSILLLFRTKVEVKSVFLGVLCYTISIFTYNTALVLFPVLFLSLLIFYQPINKKHVFILASLCVVFLLGLRSLSAVSAQKGSITIFNNETIVAGYPDFRRSLPLPLQPLIGNRYVYWITLMIERYVQSWSPSFLVLRGGQHPWQNLPNHSHLYFVEYVFAIIGVITLSVDVLKNILKKIPQKHIILSIEDKWKLVLLTLVFLSPVPAIITVDAPHATRSLFFLLLLVLSAVYGVHRVVELVSKKFIFAFVIPVIFWTIAFTSALKYVHSYFVLWPQQYPAVLMVGINNAVAQLHTTEPVAVIDSEGYAYVVFAWYNKFPPSHFFSTIQRHQPDQAGLSYGFKVGNYTFYKNEKDIDLEKIILYQDGSSSWKTKNL